MKIPVKLYNGQVLPKFINQGDWIDIYTTGDVIFEEPVANTLKRTRTNGTDISTRNVEFKPRFVSLNMAMKLPDGYEAVILPRSSTFKRYGCILVNSQGVIDNSFKGNNDIWGSMWLPTRNATIPANKAFMQFRIQLSQRASIWQKIKWIFSTNKIEFIAVDDLNSQDRGGFGSSDENKKDNKLQNETKTEGNIV